MKRFDEKMTDIIIGEMVTQLLNEDASISWSILLERLQQFLDMERDETRLRAALRRWRRYAPKCCYIRPRLPGLNLIRQTFISFTKY
ncbi:hypothetical protein [Pantoea ananatis]